MEGIFHVSDSTTIGQWVDHEGLKCASGQEPEDLSRTQAGYDRGVRV